MKMIATDLDGTLLRSDKTISNYTRQTLAKCREAGIKIVYATGRGGTAQRLVPSEIVDGRITVNGAVGYAGEKRVYNCLVPWQVAQPILVACHKQGMDITSEFGGLHYSNFSVSTRWPSIASVDNIVDFATHEIDAEKIYVPNPTEEDRVFIASILPPDLYYVETADGVNATLLQIMHKDATKMKAIVALAASWGIAMHEVVAFGDDYNDMDMLQGCGKGVAMANAVEDIKKIATESCDSNDNDGVAKWLEENILRQMSINHI